MSMEIVSAAEAARIIGVSVTMVYKIQDLEPVHPRPRMYLKADVERIAESYQPAGRVGAQKRRVSGSKI